MYLLSKVIMSIFITNKINFRLNLWNKFAPRTRRGCVYWLQLGVGWGYFSHQILLSLFMLHLLLFDRFFNLHSKGFWWIRNYFNWFLTFQCLAKLETKLITIKELCILMFGTAIYTKCFLTFKDSIQITISRVRWLISVGNHHDHHRTFNTFLFEIAVKCRF